MKNLSILIFLILLIIACPKKEPEVTTEKIVGCPFACPSGYECVETENHCHPLPHAFTCMDSCQSDRYCSASGECKINPVMCQMGQTPTRCNSSSDCYAGQSCNDGYCFYPLCKCTSNSDCDAINQICKDGVCDCFELGCKSNEECPEDHVCVKNYPLCGQCVQKNR